MISKEHEDFTKAEYIEMLYYYQEFLKSEGFTFEDFERFLIQFGYDKPTTRH